MLNLDTYILVAALEGRLRPDERRLLEDDFWCISDIVLWEMGHLARADRIKTSLDHPGLRTALDEMTIWPITRTIAIAVGSLDFQSDPADELIAATSLVHQVPLVTRDQRILGSKLVPLALYR